MGTLEQELQRIYDSEINVRISWLWDSGIDVRLGDEVNGFLAEENVKSLAEVVLWFRKRLPSSIRNFAYARSLGRDVIERAKRRVFQPPQAGPPGATTKVLRAGPTSLTLFPACVRCLIRPQTRLARQIPRYHAGLTGTGRSPVPQAL